jgi:hypothetical protein
MAAPAREPSIILIDGEARRRREPRGVEAGHRSGAHFEHLIRASLETARHRPTENSISLSELPAASPGGRWALGLVADGEGSLATSPRGRVSLAAPGHFDQVLIAPVASLEQRQRTPSQFANFVRWQTALCPRNRILHQDLRRAKPATLPTCADTTLVVMVRHLALLVLFGPAPKKSALQSIWR